MGIFETTLGHDSVRESLIQAYNEGRLPSQFLFVGIEGIGKKRFAWGASEYFLCSKVRDFGRACGKCGSCLKISQQHHENVLFIEPEKNLIKLEHTNEVRHFLSLAEDDKKPRIVIIDNVHCLNEQAGNSLLKVFEEPPPNTYFFFITHRWMQVLSTIRSRATKVAFSPLKSQDLNHWAQGDTQLIEWSRGSVKNLLEQKESGALELRNEALELFHRLFHEKNFFTLGPWREQLKEKEKDKVFLFIRYWLIYLRGMMVDRKSQKNGPDESLFTENQIWNLWQSGLTLEPGLLGHRDPILLIEEWVLSNQILKGF